MKSLLCLFLAFALSLPAAVAEESVKLPANDEGLPGEGPIRRAKWFEGLWNKKREAWKKQTEAQQGSVVFLGDSITQGWGDKMKGAFGDLKVANRGISGDTTRGVLVRLKGDVLALNPKGVVLLIGTNDLEMGASPTTILKNTKSIIGELKKHDPKMPVVLCKVFPAGPANKRPKEQIMNINKGLTAAFHEDPQVTLMETFVLYASKEGYAKKTEFPDLLHPNDIGYRKWAAGIRPILATLGFIETEVDDFKLEEGFESLFNGKDLTGWGWRAKKDLKWEKSLDGKKATEDGRFAAINGRLVVTTPPEGRRFQKFWTKREFKGDFTLKLEFRATPFADSGVFLRKPQLQCRDYSLAGPWFDLKKYKQQDWNELVIVVRDNVAHCTCNGEVIQEAMKLPASGPIGVEGDRGQMEYRRIRIRMD